MKELKHSHNITVRFNEVDSLGIVWHGHYISYFEDGREAFGKQFGISYLDIKSHGFAVPIVKTSTEHTWPLTYRGKAVIETTFKATRAAKMVFTYVIKNEQNKVVCKGETVQVFTSLENGEMCLNTPDFFIEWKLKHGLTDD